MFTPLRSYGRIKSAYKSSLAGCLLFISLCLSSTCLFAAEPWLDARDSALRIDVERLSNGGIIKVPINTYPLMWVGVLNDLETTEIKSVPDNLKNSFARVLSAGRDSTRMKRSNQSARLSLANEPQVLRHFGDKAREEFELTLRRNSINENYAYNLELTKSVNPWNEDKSHYDHSYFAVVLGNWVGLIGRVEKWWGPSWNSNLILSNNARPPTGLTLQRNYSDSFDLPVLEWLGPWTTTMFISQLDDERVIDNAKLLGMSIGFRPTEAVEINLRRTAQWGGEGRPQSFKSLLKLISGVSDNCGNAFCKPNEPGNQLGGIDVRWDMPWLGASLHGQVVGEDEAGGLPSRLARQIGMQFNLTKKWFEGTVFLEHDTTTASSATNAFNTIYSHAIYRSGYTYENRAIGATWDNDSRITSLGAIGYLSNGDKLELRYSFGEINVDDAGKRHSINFNKVPLSTVEAKWKRDYFWGQIELDGRYIEEVIDQYGRQKDNFRMAASINYVFN